MQKTGKIFCIREITSLLCTLKCALKPRKQGGKHIVHNPSQEENQT